MTPGVLIRASVIALALLSAGGLTASADDGRPPAPSGTGHPPTSSSIPLTELRPSEIRSAPTPTIALALTPIAEPLRAPARKRELVLFVGGYGSKADDGAFDELKTRFPSDRYEIRRLGDDPQFPYDTYGGVDANARVLTDQIRNISADYSGVDIVSHSMGGVVVDRAIAGGLSSDDGVVTYVAIASPHSGADFARAPAFVLPIISPVKEIVRAGGVAVARDPQSTAINDLATARPIPPPRESFASTQASPPTGLSTSSTLAIRASRSGFSFRRPRASSSTGTAGAWSTGRSEISWSKRSAPTRSHPTVAIQ